MKASNILIEQLKLFEGVRLKAYRDSKGIPTIGVGHTKGVKMGQVITMGQAESLLKADLASCENYVNRLGVARSQGQFDALVDFAFNLGTASLGGSTLLKYIVQKKSTQEIQAQFKRWDKCKIDGKLTTLAGLTKRRAWEAERYAQ